MSIIRLRVLLITISETLVAALFSGPWSVCLSLCLIYNADTTSATVGSTAGCRLSRCSSTARAALLQCDSFFYTACSFFSFLFCLYLYRHLLESFEFTLFSYSIRDCVSFIPFSSTPTACPVQEKFSEITCWENHTMHPTYPVQSSTTQTQSSETTCRLSPQQS